MGPKRGPGALALALWASTAVAAEKPAELTIGITTCNSGPASVFGVPARRGAEMLAEQINARGGIGGVPVSLAFIDEGAGVETLTSEYRRLVDAVDVDVMFASISSGICNNVAPLTEELELLNFMWDCGTQRIFEEEEESDWVYRTQADATSEIMAPLLHLLETRPDFKTLAVVNQDYAWGRDSWNIVSNALKTSRPDVEIVAELFPAFGAPDCSAEVSRLRAPAPGVTRSDPAYPFRAIDDMAIYDAAPLMPPVGEESIEWIRGLEPDVPTTPSSRFKHGS